MSLLDSLSNTVVGSSLANNVGISKISDVTYTQTGTSLQGIYSNVTTATNNAITNTGISNDTLTAPLYAAGSAAAAADPTRAADINSLVATNVNGLPDTFRQNVPSITNNSLYSIQQGLNNTITGSLNSTIAGISSFSPIGGAAASVAGSNALGSALTSANTVTTSAFSAASSAASSQLSAINNASINSAISANIPKTPTLPGGGTITDLPLFSNSTANPAATVLEEEADPTSPNYRPPGIGVTSVASDPLPQYPVNTTDVIYQEVKLFIEGVQVPLESWIVNQAIGQLPNASIQVPVQAGLMDIARYYQPKVHLFYVDQNTGGDRLLFWGHIVTVNYSQSRQQGSASISFECVHKNALIHQLTLEFSGAGAAGAVGGTNLTDSNSQQATVQVANFNSEMSIIQALQGITGMQTDSGDILRPQNSDIQNADVTKLDVRFAALEARMIGMPSTIMNLWNQLKKQIYTNPELNSIFVKVYCPLLEDGLAFFDRMSGHNFLESQIQDSRQKHCNDYARPEANKYDLLIPHPFRMNVTSAIQAQMAISSATTILGFSEEFTTFMEYFNNFFYSMEYEMLTLASPAEVPVDPNSKANLDDPTIWREQERMAIETIIKPQLPFYYAPACNVILPFMFHSMNVNQNEGDIPTRITAVSTAASQASSAASSLGVNYRAPQTVREAVATGSELTTATSGSPSKAALKDTTGSSYNVPGKYEIGRGIKQKKVNMPQWLSHFAAGNAEASASNDDETFPADGTLDAKNLADLKTAWIDRYGYASANADTDTDTPGSQYRQSMQETMNPYSPASGIMAYERLLFAAADYEFTKETVRSKTGSIDGIFNPYVIPGYPMDIIQKSPNLPSFHAMCASVSHQGTSRSIGTSISFMAAITYTEMSNYFIQPLHPWLQTALKLVNVNRSNDVGVPVPSSNPADYPNPLGTSYVDNVTQPESFLTPLQQKAQQSALPTLNTVPGVDGSAYINLANSAAGKTGPVIPGALASASSTTVTQDQATSMAQLNSINYGLNSDPAFDSNTGTMQYVQQTLINNPRAKAVADQFYKSVLGVGAVDPYDVYDFELGGAKAISRSNGIIGPGSTDPQPQAGGGEGNDNLTAVGNLRMVARPIESRKGIEDKFNIKFIDLTPQNYNGAPAVYLNQILSNSALLEPGASMFLDYDELVDFLNGIKANTQE